MNKSQIIQTILDVANNAVKSKIAVDDETMKVAKKIVCEGDLVLTFLNVKETEHVISLLSYYHSYEEIDDCIDFLKSEV